MFVSTRRFKEHTNFMDIQYKLLQERYWKLWNAHNRLLQHFGLNEVEMPQKIVLVAKDEPEPSDA